MNVVKYQCLFTSRNASHDQERDSRVKMAASKSKWQERRENSLLKFCHPLHSNSLLQSLNETRKNRQLCDGVVVIGDEEIPVQKNVLAAASPYFRLD